MADSTSCVCYDGTVCVDSTACIVDPFEGAVAGALYDSFNASMGATSTRCAEVGSTLNDIKGRISACSQSDPTKVDGVVQAGLSAAVGTLTWAYDSDMASRASNIFNRCSAAAEEFADSSAMVAKLSDNMKDIANTANKDAMADYKKNLPQDTTGTDFSEIELGKELTDLVGVGRTVADPVITPSDIITDTIRTGLGKLNKTRTGLSDITAELGRMDSLISCVSDIGGLGVASQVDEMIGQLDCMYNNVGCFNDPSLPNYGEFDVETFLSTQAPVKASNVKKGMNLSSKVNSSAEAASDTASASIAPPSNTAFNGPPQDSISTKKVDMEIKSKTIFTVPAQKKTPEKEVEMPPPPPAVIPEVVEAEPPPPPPELYPLSKFFKRIDDVYNTDYDAIDPNHTLANGFHADLLNGIKSYQVRYTPDKELDLIIKFDISLVEYKVIQNGPTIYAQMTVVTDVSWRLYYDKHWAYDKIVSSVARDVNSKTSHASNWDPDPNLPLILLDQAVRLCIPKIIPFEERFQQLIDVQLGL